MFMRVLTRFLLSFVVMLHVNAFAQLAVDSLMVFGNEQQPGSRMMQAINDRIIQGNAIDDSINAVIRSALYDENSELLSALAKDAMAADLPSSVLFLQSMKQTNNLFEATKLAIESQPQAIVSLIDISVALYPDFAQDVINAAVMTGEMDPNAALIAAIAAGADPTSVSEATAVGGTVATTISGPIGLGLGAGGAGGGDPSASTN